MNPIPPGHILIAVFAIVLAASPPARAADDPIAYRCTQSGFADGAIVSGWFVGRDRDDDGMLHASELSHLGFRFSGNRVEPAFTMGMGNRAGLAIDAATATLMHLAVVGPGDSRELEYDAFGWPGLHVPGRVTDNDNGLISISWERLEVASISPVPEPRRASLWLGGLPALAVAARGRLCGVGDAARVP